MNARNELIAALKAAILEASPNSAPWVDWTDDGTDAVLDGHFDLGLIADSLLASGFRPPPAIIVNQPGRT